MAQRLLWQPLWSRLVRLLRSAPDYPFGATLAALALISLALPVSFFLPPILIWDAALQWLYDRYGGAIEVLWEDGGAMLDIAFNSAALEGTELTRGINQTLRKLQEDPVGVMSDAVSEVCNAAIHPIQTAQTIHMYTRPAVDGFFKSLKLSWWIKDPAGGTPASQ